jgi:hypothetical protein
MIHWSKTTIPVSATGISYTFKRMEDNGNLLFANELSIYPTTKFNNMQKCEICTCFPTKAHDTDGFCRIVSNCKTFEFREH